MTDIDLSKPISRDASDCLRALLGSRGMIFFRNQDLTPEQQISFASNFGEILVNPYFASVPGHPAVAQVLKEPDQKQNIGERWHTDNSYDVAPALGSVLYAKEVPPTGGDTLFANMYAAYDSLSEGLKRTLVNLRAVHSTRHIFSKDGYHGSRDTDGRIRTTETNHREADHPVVITHPISGNKALFVNPGLTTHIAGWTVEESHSLLRVLYEHAQRPEFQCRLRWQAGTIALWDNRCTWHKALNDYSGYRRLMHRVQIQGVQLH
ncbi:TauD/TfdA dioxygenase family protein [Cupriavidus pinatubonensis]|uniref:TauD/TfdA dioxygenase family protein n=1 Tax=Cupriavidus pinatubonensis TaxID=248026 RepID=UPI001FD60F3E|nr:TauD/TfdA family dioxygenase [Cupriavidus pinatubonensis]